MKKEEIQAELAKAKRQLASAKEMNVTAAIKKAEDKISKFEQDLKDLESENPESVVVTEGAKKETSAKEKKHGGKRPNAGRKKDPNKPAKEKGKHGGAGRGQGRKIKEAAKVETKPTKMIAPPIKVVKRSISKPTKSTVKQKSVRAFGQTVTYKNESEFCSKLISAFKKRRTVYKTKNKKTKPVFGVITSKVGDAVNKAIDNISSTQISKNPKLVLAQIRNIEKKGKSFLESFKPILGSDYKQSEIGKEFGEIEKSIQKFIEKFKK